MLFLVEKLTVIKAKTEEVQTSFQLSSLQLSMKMESYFTLIRLVKF